VLRRAGRRLRSRDPTSFRPWGYQGMRSGGGAFAEGSAAEVGALEGDHGHSPVGSAAIGWTALINALRSYPRPTGLITGGLTPALGGKPADHSPATPNPLMHA
jgi:hypothetical protein